MLLSEMGLEIDIAADRFGDMIFAVGIPNGSWKRFGSISVLSQGEMSLACLEIADGRYYEDVLPASTFRQCIHDFLEEHGDMPVAVMEGDVLHTHVDLNVDQDVGDDGNDVNVAILQAYIRKAAFRP
ncbi:hypothetical protein G6L37_00610 [Agrobacterium rubi]|nr:hypothetical protein [Agrobacterium rubi]NTF23891.1 hypothetical protein [Agrobacterium rubi]